MRSFNDPKGQQWRVWKVTPSATVYHERRASPTAAGGDHARGGGQPYSGEERRKGDIQQGWLCFDSDAERRRFYPVPYGWEGFSEERLVRLLLASSPVRRTEGVL